MGKDLETIKHIVNIFNNMQKFNKYNITLREFKIISGIIKSTMSRWLNDCRYNKNIEYDQNENIKETKCKFNVLRIFQFIKNSLSQNPFVSLDKLTKNICNKLKINISRTTIAEYLKKMGYSKKKCLLNYMSSKSLKNLKIRTKEFKNKIKNINISDIICLDETYINPKIYSNYGWSVKNKKLQVNKMRPRFPKQSIMMSININEVIDYKIINTSYNKERFETYLENMIKTNKITGKYILMDNVIFHKSKGVKRIIEESGNYLLYIPPYSPQYNPIETVFAHFKNQIRKNISIKLLGRDMKIFMKRFKRYVKNCKFIKNLYENAFIE